jgi:NAD(P)-dependent dehydrogenase (short-subunit alcohol dehydrogenase family)
MSATAIYSEVMTDADIKSSPTVLLTGPNRGLGYETARALAREGVSLILVGRPSRAFDAVAAITRSDGARHVICIEADFASLQSVRLAGERVRRGIADGEFNAPSAIVANAGVQYADRVHTSTDGFEATFAVNVLANHVLITELVRSLQPGGNVVIVGSGTHFGRPGTTLLVAAPKWDDPKVLATPQMTPSAREGQRAYSTSKLAVNYLANELQRRHLEHRFNVFDPGLMPATGLARDMSKVKQFAWNNVLPRLVNIVPGMSTTAKSGSCLARLALGADYPDLRGGYVEIDKLSKASAASFDEERESALWEACAQMSSTAVA